MQNPLQLPLGRPFTTTLDIVVSPVHLKLKYQNLHREPVILRADLEVAKKIHHALQKDQEEGLNMEINMTFLKWKL